MVQITFFKKIIFIYFCSRNRNIFTQNPLPLLPVKHSKKKKKLHIILVFLISHFFPTSEVAQWLVGERGDEKWLIRGENIGTRKERLFSLFASYKTVSIALSLEETEWNVERDRIKSLWHHLNPWIQSCLKLVT